MHVITDKRTLPRCKWIVRASYVCFTKQVTRALALYVDQPAIVIKMTFRPLSPELEEKARKELNEDPKRIANDLQHMKDWISKQPHLRVRLGTYS